jgi:putative ATP-dependent endonuclease of OLD family
MMKLTKLTIKNFRGFEEETIDFDDITVFVGENNTGKTTVLDAIRFVIGSKGFNGNLTRYDFHLNSPIAKPGEVGNIDILAEISEQLEDEWPPEITQTLDECVDIDTNGLQHVYVSLKASYVDAEERIDQSKEFVNGSGGTKGTKVNSSKNFSALRNLLPIFHIDTLRNAYDEFGSGSGPYKTFLSSDTIEPEKKAELETELGGLNTKIIDVLGNIRLLKENLKKSMEVITGSEASVDIQPLPTNINDLIGKATVILESSTGVKLPLHRYGSGAQSLSVLFLYEAFLTVLLEKEYDRYSEPILLIEEPEAHLHPSAVRVFWQFLKEMPGQKIITTHSGDIISNVPFSKIRRISGINGTNRVKKLSDSSFTDQENRILKNYIMYSRGELFFARCWLLVEGETDQIFFENLLNNNGFLDKKGIRIIQYSQLNIDVATKIANELNVRWFFITDGDPAGATYTAKAITAIPQGSDQADYVYQFPEKTIEVHLMANGFVTFYENRLSPANQQIITTFGLVNIQYYEKLYYLLNDQKRSYRISKPEIVLDVVDDIIKNSKPFPPVITDVKTKLENIL